MTLVQIRMENCQTCKHWEELHYTDDEPSPPEHPVYYTGDDQHFSPFREEVEPAPGRWGWCHRVEDIYLRSLDCRFLVEDASEYRATLKTRSDFGCVEHEVQE